VIAVVTPENVRELGASVRFLASLGARRIALDPAWEQRWSDDDLAAWERELESLAALWSEVRGGGRDLAIVSFDRKVIAASRGEVTDVERCSVGARNVAVAPSGNLYPCERLVADDRDPRFVIGHVDRGVDEARVRAILRGPADPECEPCPEKWRCGAACACANLAETGATHVPGPVQCWHEQTTARIADRAAMELVEAGSEAFASWIYGSQLAKRRALPVVSAGSAGSAVSVAGRGEQP